MQYHLSLALQHSSNKAVREYNYNCIITLFAQGQDSCGVLLNSFYNINAHLLTSLFIQ